MIHRLIAELCGRIANLGDLRSSLRRIIGTWFGIERRAMSDRRKGPGLR